MPRPIPMSQAIYTKPPSWNFLVNTGQAEVEPLIWDNFEVPDDVDTVYHSDVVGLIDQHGGCDYLQRLQDVGRPLRLYSHYVFNDQVRRRYPNIDFRIDLHSPYRSMQYNENLLRSRDVPTNKSWETFAMTLVGSDREARQFLTAAMWKWGWFDPNTSTKNFKFSTDRLDGNIMRLTADLPEHDRVCRKFIMTDGNDEAERFYQTIYSDEYNDPGDHCELIKSASLRINRAFLHLVAEVDTLSYHPVVGEKSMFPIVCKAIWASYASLQFHHHLESVWGFRLFRRLFDYDFDLEPHPVLRLVKLMSMLARYRHLTAHEWHDLYLLEQDTIEHNHDWYYSRSWIKKLEIHA
jgi:hypothetical protein